MNRKEEGSPAWTAFGSPRSAKTTTKRSTAHARAHCFLSDTAICLTAIGLLAASVCGADYAADHLTNLTLGLAIFALGFIFGLLFAVQS